MGELKDDCLFCRIIKGEISADIVYRDDDVVAFRDIDPQAPVHILVIPARHIESLDVAEGKDADILGKVVYRATQLAKDEGISEDGYRLVFNCGERAGYSVFHVHLHLLGGRDLQWPPG